MRLMLIRSATLLVQLGGLRLLVDPMLADAGTYPPLEGVADQRRNPLVPLPEPAEEIARAADAVVVTHLHGDHFDRTAVELLDKDLPLFCQPSDASTLAERGFRSVFAVSDSVQWRSVELLRTSGRHGPGELGENLGPVSGFVLRSRGEPSVYIAGDTIWCPEVAAALEMHRPNVTVVNAAGARLGDSEPIVMTPGDVATTCQAAPWTTVVAVHLEALNHCPVTRAELRAAGLPILIPADGEALQFE